MITEKELKIVKYIILVELNDGSVRQILSDQDGKEIRLQTKNVILSQELNPIQLNYKNICFYCNKHIPNNQIHYIQNKSCHYECYYNDLDYSKIYK